MRRAVTQRAGLGPAGRTGGRGGAEARPAQQVAAVWRWDDGRAGVRLARPGRWGAGAAPRRAAPARNPARRRRTWRKWFQCSSIRMFTRTALSGGWGRCASLCGHNLAMLV